MFDLKEKKKKGGVIWKKVVLILPRVFKLVDGFIPEEKRCINLGMREKDDRESQNATASAEW